MDENLTDRLDVVGRDLQRRAQSLGQSPEDQDTALLMEGLAVTIDAIRSLAATASRLDGPEGLGGSGD